MKERYDLKYFRGKRTLLGLFRGVPPFMTKEEAASLNPGDWLLMLVGGTDIERKLTYPAGEFAEVISLDTNSRQGPIVTIATPNGIVNSFDALDFNGLYPFRIKRKRF